MSGLESVHFSDSDLLEALSRAFALEERMPPESGWEALHAALDASQFDSVEPDSTVLPEATALRELEPSPSALVPITGSNRPRLAMIGAAAATVVLVIGLGLCGGLTRSSAPGSTVSKIRQTTQALLTDVNTRAPKSKTEHEMVALAKQISGLPPGERRQLGGAPSEAMARACSALEVPRGRSSTSGFPAPVSAACRSSSTPASPGTTGIRSTATSTVSVATSSYSGAAGGEYPPAGMPLRVSGSPWSVRTTGSPGVPWTSRPSRQGFPSGPSEGPDRPVSGPGGRPPDTPGFGGGGSGVQELRPPPPPGPPNQSGYGPSLARETMQPGDSPYPSEPDLRVAAQNSGYSAPTAPSEADQPGQTGQAGGTGQAGWSADRRSSDQRSSDQGATDAHGT